MTPDIGSTLIQSSGAAAVTGIFIWYLKGFNKMLHEERRQNNDTLKQYLQESVKVKTELAARLQEFSDVNREQKDVIEKLYIELVKKSRDTKAYENSRRRNSTDGVR